MKSFAITTAIVLATAISTPFAQAGEMKGMDMKDMGPTRMSKDDKPGQHTTKGTVKKVTQKAAPSRSITSRSRA